MNFAVKKETCMGCRTLVPSQAKGGKVTTKDNSKL
jgi:hypothetical protein